MRCFKNLFLLFFLLSYGGSYAQLSPGKIHLDSLTKQEFLNMYQQRLSIAKYQDSTVMLLRILSNARFVEGLEDTQEGYEIFIRSARNENVDCEEVRLQRVSEEDDKTELNISVVIDYSGSMFFDPTYIPRMQQAAQSFMDNVNGAYFTRVNFDSYVDPVSPNLTQTPRSIRSDNLNKYGQATALYDAIVEGVKTLSSKAENKFVVVFTDGIENSSGMSANTVVDIARKDSTKVVGISFGTALELQRLRDICEQTNYDDPNNQFFYSADYISDVQNKFQELEKGVFGNYYKVTSTCLDEDFVPSELVIKKAETGDSVVIDVSQELSKIREIDDDIYFGSIPFAISKSNVTDGRYRKALEETADDIVNHLLAHPNDEIIIEGHASPDGEDDTNWLLSFERANTVEQLIKDYITKNYGKNIEALKAMKRISVEYHGHERPIFPVTSPFNPENRRVSIILKEG